MTTICYRSGVLAADGMSTTGDTIVGTKSQKVFRLKSGGLCAGTGPRMLLLRYRQWLDGEIGERPSLVMGDERKTEAYLLVLRADGVLELHEPEGIEELDEEFYALGSGEVAARAALIMGADAVKAIEIASAVDVYTGGTIHSERLVIRPTLSELPIENIDPPPAPDWRMKRGLNVPSRLVRHIER